LIVANGLQTPGERALDEIFRDHGKDALGDMVRRRQAADANLSVLRMDELPDIIEPPALQLGVPVLDDHFRIRQGDFSIITGIPSHGKSTFVNEVAGRMALRHGWSTAFASFEQRPQIDHKRNLRVFFNQKRVADQSPKELAAADHWINEHFSFIVPDKNHDLDLEWVLGCAEDAVLKHQVRMVVLDPWNELDHWRPNGMSLTEYTGFAIKAFKTLATKMLVHVMVVAHPAKQRRQEDGSYGVPSLYDVSDSAHWYNKPDLGVIVHRQGPVDSKGNAQPDTIIRIAKSRYHEVLGKPGDVLADFNPEANRYIIEEPEAWQRNNPLR
jgi:twinkle protein